MVMLSIKWMDEQRGKRRAADSSTEKDIGHILWVERREEHDKKGELRIMESQDGLGWKGDQRSSTSLP